MTLSATEVEAALLALDAHDRATIIQRVLPTLGGEAPEADQHEVDAHWRTELHRRIDDIEAFNVELLDVAQSHAGLRAELAARRNRT